MHTFAAYLQTMANQIGPFQPVPLSRVLHGAHRVEWSLQAPVMDAVLKQWLGINPKASFDGAKAKSAPRGDPTLPSTQNMSGNPPRNKSAPNLMHRLSGSTKLQKLTSNVKMAVSNTDSQAGSSMQSTVDSDPQEAAGTEQQPSQQAEHVAACTTEFAKTPLTGLSKAPSSKATEVVSYSEEELETLEAADSCCQAWAADSPLAVSNCHMLRFLAALGPQHARTDSGSTPQLLSRVSTSASMGADSYRGPKARNRVADIGSSLRKQYLDQVGTASSDKPGNVANEGRAASTTESPQTGDLACVAVALIF